MHKTPISTTTHPHQHPPLAREKEGEEVGTVVYRADTHCVLLEGAASQTPNGRGFYYYYIYRLTHDQTPPKGRGYEKVVSGKNIEVKNGQSKDRSSEDKGSEKAP